MPTSAPVALERYDTRTIVLHWITALLVVVLWVSAHFIDSFPRGPARTNMRSVHVTLGLILAVVLVSRIVWRRLAGAHLPAVGAPTLARLASAVHVVLYVLLVVEVLLGITNAWARGDSFYGLFTIPSFAPDNRPLRNRIGGVHEFVANTILVVAALHASAALVHHYVWKDEVLRRMWPARGSPRPR